MTSQRLVIIIAAVGLALSATAATAQNKAGAVAGHAGAAPSRGPAVAIQPQSGFNARTGSNGFAQSPIAQPHTFSPGPNPGPGYAYTGRDRDFARRDRDDFRFRHHRNRFFFGVAPDTGYTYDYSYDDDDYDPSCWRVQQVPTRWGWRWRRFWVCG